MSNYSNSSLSYCLGKNQELITQLKQTTLQLEKQRKENEHLKDELKIQDSHVTALQHDLSICRDNYKVIRPIELVCYSQLGDENGLRFYPVKRARSTKGPLNNVTKS